MAHFPPSPRGPRYAARTTTATKTGDGGAACHIHLSRICAVSPSGKGSGIHTTVEPAALPVVTCGGIYGGASPTPTAGENTGAQGGAERRRRVRRTA